MDKSRITPAVLLVTTPRRAWVGRHAPDPLPQPVPPPTDPDPRRPSREYPG
jgi:hypothetical protein